MAVATSIDIHSLLERGLGQSSAEATEFVYVETQEDLTRFGANAITQNVMKSSRRLSIRVQDQGREAKTEISQVTPEGLAKGLAEALEVARWQNPDPELLPMLAQVQSYEPVEWPRGVDVGPEGRADVVSKAVRACHRQGARAGGTCSQSHTRTIVMNSKGIWADGETCVAEFSLTAEKDGGSGWATTVAQRHEDLESDVVVERALEKCLRGQNPREIPVGTYPVVLHSAAVADLIGMFNWIAFSGQDYLEGKHFAIGKIGEPFFDPKFSVADDAWAVPGLPFDFEGIAKRRLPLIDGGRFVGLVHDRHSALKMRTEPTGHGLPWPNTWGPLAQNVSVHAGDVSRESVLRGLDRGLLITHLHYINVVDRMDLSITGLTRDGVFWVENGQIQHSVKNMRFTDTLLSLFGEIEAISAERELTASFWEGKALVPAVRLSRMHFSSPTNF